MSFTQPYLAPYRLPLFQRLAEDLEAEGIELRVFHLDPGDRLRRRGEAVSAAWAHLVPGVERTTPAGHLMFRKLPAGWAQPDVLVTEMAAGNLNAWTAAATRQPFILVGHGSSGSTGSSGTGQRLENRLIRHADHNLTYLPSGAAAVIAETGIPAATVTPFLNSTDTAGLRALRNAVTPADLARFAGAHGLRVGPPTILCVGRLDAVKRLDLLLATLTEARSRIPELQVIVGGRGPGEAAVRALAAAEPGMAWLGRMGPSEMALASRLGHVLLNPGPIGLVAVDALALNLLVVAAAGIPHGPEVEYLRPGIELVTGTAEPSALADTVMGAVAAGRPPVRAAGDYPTVEAAADTIAACVTAVLRRQPSRYHTTRLRPTGRRSVRET